MSPMMGAPMLLARDDEPSEARPLTDEQAQWAMWRERLERYARIGKGADAHRLAGRLLLEHGDGARRELQALPRGAVWRSADAMLERCGLGVLL